MDTGSAIYAKALEAYMRKGIPIALTLKQQARPTTHYIWRTRGDAQVRPSHAANDGRIFAWDDQPPTGHPGEDFGCRCTAEPYFPTIDERIDITLSGVSDSGSPWSSRDFVNHYYNGGGRGVTVRQTGHLQAIVSAYMDQRGQALKDQITTAARQSGDRSFSYDFYRSYSMIWVVFSIGNTKIGRTASGRVFDKSGVLDIAGDIDFYLEDAFEDPLDIGIEVIDPGETIGENIVGPLDRLIHNQPGRNRFGIHTGEPYSITDAWSGHFEGQVYADATRSSFA